MFGNLWKSLRTGVVTQAYPREPARCPDRFRGRPDLDPERCDGCGDCVQACPTRVIRLEPATQTHPDRLTLDLAGCIFCADCVTACPAGAVRMTQEFELASFDRDTLRLEAWLQTFEADASLVKSGGPEEPGRTTAGASCPEPPLERIGGILRRSIGAIFGRSLHIREVSAGSCNGCDLEVQAINNPIFDSSRFGIHFVASPRHADMLLVTGPVSRNMAGPLIEAYNACPEPRLVERFGNVLTEHDPSRDGHDPSLNTDCHDLSRDLFSETSLAYRFSEPVNLLGEIVCRSRRSCLIWC